MNLYLDRRTDNERRDGDREIPLTEERRMIPERRNPGMSAAERDDYNRVLADGYWGASEDDSTPE